MLHNYLINFYRQLVAHPNLPDALANLAQALSQQNIFLEAIWLCDLAKPIAIFCQAIYTKTIKNTPLKSKPEDFLINVSQLIQQVFDFIDSSNIQNNNYQKSNLVTFF